jgi:hypothetical protein
MATREIASKAPSGRVRRTPLTVRNRLDIKVRDPNYVYRVVNVVDDRVDQLQAQGYEIDPDNNKVGDKRVDAASSLGSVAEISVGQGTKAVIMRQHKDYYAEDQAAKQAEIDEREASMKLDAAKGK